MGDGHFTLWLPHLNKSVWGFPIYYFQKSFERCQEHTTTNSNLMLEFVRNQKI